MFVPAEEWRVLYGGCVQVPLCIGSVAVPLAEVPRTQQTISGFSGSAAASSNGSGAFTASSGPSRCSHRRYCYLRDGGSLAQDSFYRWLLYERGTARQNEDIFPANIGHKRGRSASASTDDPKLQTSASISPRSPSLLYSMISHVVFTVPKSFPEPCRVCYKAPFLIEDDTWASHLVELRLHFHLELGIPPVSFVHQVFLHPDPGTTGHLGLLSSFFGKPKPDVPRDPQQGELLLGETMRPIAAAIADRAPSEAKRNGEGGNEMPCGEASCVQLRTFAKLATLASFSERKDTIRIVHPSEPVIVFVRRVLAMANSTVIHQLEQLYWNRYYGPSALGVQEDFGATMTAVLPAHYITSESGVSATESVSRSSTVAAAPWDLPFEFIVHCHVACRAARSTRALRLVLEDLVKEQEDLLRNGDGTVQRLVTSVQGIQDGLEKLHVACLSLRESDAVSTNSMANNEDTAK